MGTPELTKRQREIMQLIAVGYSTAEIAEALALKSRTVKYHVDALRRLFGVRRKRELIVIAQQMEAK